MGVFIGLDVSLSKTAVCVVDREGVVLWQGKVSSEPRPLVARLAEWSGVIDLAGIEACPMPIKRAGDKGSASMPIDIISRGAHPRRPRLSDRWVVSHIRLNRNSLDVGVAPAAPFSYA